MGDPATQINVVFLILRIELEHLLFFVEKWELDTGLGRPPLKDALKLVR